jgi:hypothetical protein
MNKENRLKATPFPCGQCLHCRINQARVWQHRILLESMVTGENLWVTLTYNNKSLPKPPYVSKTDVQTFLKRLRKVTPDKPFRYFIVGEYGDKTYRPHYHCCFFGLSPEDAPKIFIAWGKCDREGIFFGEINEYSARYTAGYTTAKLTKQNMWKKYGYEPEFMLSSRRNGGIGYPAVVEIAKNWRNTKWNDNRIIRDLQHGRISQPLGRYLTKALARLLKIPESKFEGEYWLHQEEIFRKHKMGDPFEYYQQIVTEDLAKASSKQKRHEIFKKIKTKTL